MIERLKEAKVVGIKQTAKALKTGNCKKVYLAKDASCSLVKGLEQMALDNSIEVIYVETMRDLGRLCGIDVKAAAAATLIE